MPPDSKRDASLDGRGIARNLMLCQQSAQELAVESAHLGRQLARLYREQPQGQPAGWIVDAQLHGWAVQANVDPARAEEKRLVGGVGAVARGLGQRVRNGMQGLQQLLRRMHP